MNMDLKFYWKIALRRLPVMLALFLFFSGVGIALAIKLPTTYETSARLLVESAQIPGELAASTVSTSAAEQLEIIRQRLLTRANLIDIANKFSVFDNISSMSPDTVVDRMRAATDITSRGTPLIVTISFKSSNPRTAAAVVNEYVTLILNANSEFRTGRAEVTLDFFEQEVARLNQELELQSQKILDFKRQNASALPDGQEYRRTRLTTLEEQVARDEREKSELTDQRERIVEIFETTGRLRPPSEADLSPEERRLAQLQREFDNALIVYSENNPKVRVLRAQIEQLEAIVLGQKQATDSDEAERNSQKALFDVTMADLDGRLEAIEARIETRQAQIDSLIAAIAKTPENAIVLDTLERDYATIRSQYAAATDRLSQARMGERIELSAKGQRMTIIERATVPNAPSSPNRPMVASAGAGVGLAAAAGFFLLLELVNRTVRRPVELVGRLGIAPLATIPYMETNRHKVVRRTLQVLVVLLVLTGIPAGLWAIDTYYRPLDLLFWKVVSQLNLT